MTYWLDVHIRQSVDQVHHGRDSVINTVQQDRLVAYRHAFFVESLRASSSNPGNLLCAVNVCMHTDMLTHLPGLLREVNDDFRPSIVWIDESGRRNANALGCESQDSDMGDLEEFLSEPFDLFGLEEVGIATGEDDVSKVRRVGNVLQARLPAFQQW